MRNKVEWSDKRWKEFIVEQRKRMWLPDTVEKLAKWLDLKQGMQVADIGCGLGYLGWTYWEYFGNNGSYIGIDISEKLIEEAKELSNNWAINGTADFKKGDAYNLDLEDNSFDLVMCQTLLMHLDKPEKAISEMKRILKPGGTILCKEPDNLTYTLQTGFSSLPDITLEEQIISHKINYYRFKGKKKLKYGDNTIGNRLSYMLFQEGFRNIDVRLNDKAVFMHPPYDLDFQKKAVKDIKDSVESINKEDAKYWKKITRRDVLAGGGSEYLLRKYFLFTEKRSKLFKKLAIEQIEKENFFSCYSGGSFFVAKGTKYLNGDG